MTQWPIEIVAHRGLHDSLPENSLPAMLAAWDAEITWCECDVHLSADGLPVVIHDETLDRTTTGSGRALDFPWSELKKLSLLAAGKPTEHRLPLLDELLHSCRPDRRLLVETKPPLGERIVPIARKIADAGGMLHSFHLPDMMLAFEATLGKWPVALLLDREQVLPHNFAGRIHVNHEALELLDLDPSVAVGVWTVNDAAQIRRIAGMQRVSMIITDIPLVAQQIIREERAKADAGAKKEPP